jgi:hypothetical protein
MPEESLRAKRIGVITSRSFGVPTGAANRYDRFSLANMRSKLCLTEGYLD